MRLSIVEEEVRITRQTMAQMHPSQGCATSQMKWRPNLTRLQEVQCRRPDYAAVEGGHI